MKKTKKMIAFLIIMGMMMLTIMPLNIVNAAITDIDEGATTNTKTTLEKKETGTEEVPYNTNLEEYIASKKAEAQSIYANENYKDEWLALFVAENGVYKYPVALHTYFTGVTTTEGGSGYIAVGDPDDLTNSGTITSGSATYNYRLEYKEITVTKAANPYEIKEVNVTLQAPTVGDKITVTQKNDSEYVDTYEVADKFPNATSKTDNIEIDYTMWITGTPIEMGDGYDKLFNGTFEKDKYYYAEIGIYTADDYFLADGVSIKVNGEKPAEVFGLYSDKTKTFFIAKIKAVEEVKEVKYKVLNGANQTVDIGKDEELTFRFDIEYSNFITSGKVYVDDKEVASTNYTSKEGSTIITFKDEYKNALQVGKHTLKVTVSNGEVNTEFTIAKTEKEETTNKENTVTENKIIDRNNNPKTGDRVIIYLTLFIVALVGSITLKKKTK